MQFVKLLLWIGKTHSEGIVTFGIGVQCVQCWAKRVAPHLAFPIDSCTIFEICGGEKKLEKKLELKTTTVNGPHAVNFIIFFFFGEITTYVFTHFFRVKHVVCSPSKVVLDLI